MPVSKIFSSSWFVLSYFHIRITKSNSFDFVAIFDIHNRLLLAIAGFTFAYASGLVESDFSAFVCRHYFLCTFWISKEAFLEAPLCGLKPPAGFFINLKPLPAFIQ
jgi:hypothetical protein